MAALKEKGFDWERHIEDDGYGQLCNGKEDGDMVYEIGETTWTHQDPKKSHTNK